MTLQASDSVALAPHRLLHSVVGWGGLVKKGGAGFLEVR